MENNQKRRKRRCTGKRKPNYASLLYLIRVSYGWTLAELSAEVGIEANTLSLIERGNMARIGVYERLSTFFEVPLSCFFSEELSTAIRASFVSKRFQERKAKMAESFTRKNIEMRRVGDLGEAFVVEQEKKRLCGTVFEELVDPIFSTERDAHFDILSVDAITGELLYIEVKSTSGGGDDNIYLSADELQFLQNCLKNGKRYEMHRVYYVNHAAKRYERVLTAEQVLRTFDFEPVKYKLREKTK